MATHIITVALRDSPLLDATYASCAPLIEGPDDFTHWIFIKEYSSNLENKYALSKSRASQDNGIYNAMNLAFKEIADQLNDEDIVIFLNAGDCFHASELRAHTRIHTNKNADLSVAGVRLTKNGAPFGTRKAPDITSDEGRIIYKEFPCHQATFYSARPLKSRLKSNGYIFDERFKSCADLELYLSLVTARLIRSDCITTSYDIDGFSSDQPTPIAKEKQRLIKEYSATLIWHIYSWIWRIRAALVKPKRLLLKLTR